VKLEIELGDQLVLYRGGNSSKLATLPNCRHYDVVGRAVQ
jgi:hypothetical protein